MICGNDIVLFQFPKIDKTLVQDQLLEIKTETQRENPFVFSPLFESSTTAMTKLSCIKSVYSYLCGFQVQVVCVQKTKSNNQRKKKRLENGHVGDLIIVTF